MRYLERAHLERFCALRGLDVQEIDSGVTYYENLKHLRGLIVGGEDPRAREDRMEDYTQSWIEAHRRRGYRPSRDCPRCGKPGSGLHARWVLNDRKQRFEPYFYVAHSRKGLIGYYVKWCYVRKAQAIQELQELE